MVQCPSCAGENPDGFTFCGRCGAPLAPQAATPAHEERKVVSVLFCDLVGFTAASEGADPEDVRARIRPYHERLRADIEHFGGTVEKFIGDAVMAVFGAPVTHEDDAERAVRSGLRIIESLAELNAADATLGFRVRVGINTGEALVTLGARPDLGEGFVAGDVVNTASRIQGAAPIDGVAVSEETQRQTERVFVYEPLPPVELKGKAEPVELFRAVEARARFGTDLIRTHDSPFVGRVAERAMLTSLFDRCARDSRTQLVTLVGEPGAGKSRLCAELFAHIDELPDLITWRQGRCLPYGDGITFWALGEIVKAQAGIFETDSPDVAAEKLEASLPEVEQRAFLRARLLPLLGIDSGVATTREESFSAWQTFLESMASDAPAVLVFEDLHWADSALLEFIAHLAEWAEGVPLLVVCTTRPELFEANPDWTSGIRNAHTINLAPLTTGETNELVIALLERSSSADDVRQTIVDRAGGNPLYAEEFVRLIADSRIGVGWEFPDNVQALIAARLDTLPPVRKSLLQDAAVIGKVFWAGALAEMAGRPSADVQQDLHELSRKELVRPSRLSTMEGEAEYAFWHGLVRDVAYQQIPRAERARRHEAAAGWIEARAAGRVEDMAELLAHHALAALELARGAGDASATERLTDASRRYLRMAGERAMGLDASQAEARLTRALELTPEGHWDRPELLIRWAEAAFQEMRLREAADALGAAKAALRAAGRYDLLAEALILETEVSRSIGGGSPLDLAAEAVALLAEGHDPRLRVQALSELSRCQWLTGSQQTAIETADQAIALADAAGLDPPLKAHGYRGLARAESGERDGIDEADRAVDALIAGGAGRLAANMMNNLALLRWVIYGPALTLDALDDGIAFARKRNMSALAELIRSNSAEILVDRGRLDEGISIWREHADASLQLGDMFDLVDASTCIGHFLAERGELGEAVERATTAASHIDEVESLDLEILQGRLALVWLRSGDPERARRTLNAVSDVPFARQSLFYCLALPIAVRTALALDDVELAARLIDGITPTYDMHVAAATSARAAVTEITDGSRAALPMYVDASERMRALGYVRELAYSLLGLGRCLVDLGEPEARAVLTEARDLFASFGFHSRVEEAESHLVQTAGASG